jgi:hypothetical protein
MESVKSEYTVGDLARRWGIEEWKIRRVFDCGDLPQPRRFGLYRIIPSEDVHALVEALKARGYLPEGHGDA